MLRMVKSKEAIEELLKDYDKCGHLYFVKGKNTCFNSATMFALCGTIIDINENDRGNRIHKNRLYLKNRTPVTTYFLEEWLEPLSGSVNKSMAYAKGLSKETIDAIEDLHERRMELYGVMDHCLINDDLPKYDDECTQIEFELQELWGFEKNANFHIFWDRPRCICPTMDNHDRYPYGNYVINSICPLHGAKAQENITKEVKKEDIKLKLTRAEIIKRLKEKFDVINVWSDNRTSPECSIEGKQIKVSIRYSPKFELREMEKRVNEFNDYLLYYGMTTKVKTSKYHTYIQIYNIKKEV